MCVLTSIYILTRNNVTNDSNSTCRCVMVGVLLFNYEDTPCNLHVQHTLVNPLSHSLRGKNEDLHACVCVCLRVFRVFESLFVCVCV